MPDAHDPAPAHGERRAVGGFVGQYLLAAMRTYAALRSGELRWVRLADPVAGRVDDFQIGTDGRVDAHQVKWSRFAGSLSFRDFTREQPRAPSYVAQLADGWARLRSVNTNARVVVHFVTNDLPSTADRLPPVGRGRGKRAGASAGAFAALLAECWRPARAAALAGADVDAVVGRRWRSAWEALRQAAGLAADEWPAFVRDCELEFGTPSLDAAAAGVGGHGADPADWRADVGALAALLQRLVADPTQRVEFSRDELLDGLGWRARVEYRHRHEFPDPDIPYRAVTSTVRALRGAVSAFQSGYVALVGTPGSGKSTLLTRTLRYAPERVIRYYAYVPTSIGPNVRRGEASHFLHDLVVALEKQGIRAGPTLPVEDVARLSARLEAQLQTLSDEWRRTGRKALLLVDGLDHIPREQSPTRSLLTELPPPERVPEGVLIILGSQTDRLPGLAAAVRDQLDQPGRRLTMQPLTREDVLSMVREAHLDPVPIAAEQERVFALTAGHPLALNYVLNRLRASSGPAVAEVLDQVAPFRDRIDVQYVAHWQQIESDFGLVRLLALLARLRGAIRMTWVERWPPPEAVYRLVQEFGHYFRREPNGRWAFFHNSFRAFLAERTRNLPGIGAEDALYRNLADECAAAMPGDPARWDELYYRARAGDHAAVLALAQPGVLREQFLAGRPADGISADVSEAIAAAMATRDVVGLTRALLMDTEFAQRAHYAGLLPMAELQLALGDDDAAVDAVRDGAQLRVDPEAALRAATALDARGLRDEARRVFALAEPMDVLGAPAPIEDHQLREVQSQLAAWVEAAPRFRSVQELLGVIERLQVADNQYGRGRPTRQSQHDASESPSVDADLTAQLRSELLQMLARALDQLDRPDDADAVIAHLFDSAVGSGSAWFWAAVDGWRHAHSVGQHLRAKQRLDGMRDGLARWSGGALDADKTTTLAEGLARVAGDVYAARALVSTLPQPTQVSALTASGSDSGFGPFVPRFVLNRVLGALGDERPLSEVVPDAEGEGQPLVFFERAVVTVARLHGEAWSDRRVAPASFIAATLPVMRLFQNVGHEWKDGWHLIAAARGELYELLVRAAALHGPDVVTALRESVDRIWADPTLDAGWPPELKRRVILALLDAGAAQSWAVPHLRRTEPQHFEGEALEQELPEAAGQVRAWLRVGDTHAARATLQTVLAAAFGVGYKDYQMDHWVRWGMRANQRDPAGAPARIARLVAAVGGMRGAHGATSATKWIIRAAAAGGPVMAFAVAEWCLAHGLTGWITTFETLLPAVLERAPSAAATAAVFYRHLVLPFDPHPSSDLLDGIVHALDVADPRDRDSARALLGEGLDVHALGSARPALRATLAGDELEARRLERDGSVVDSSDLFRVVEEFEGLGLTLLELQARTRTLADVRELLARVKPGAYMIRWELVFGGFVAVATADEVREMLQLLPPAEKTWSLRLLAADRLAALGYAEEARQVIDVVLLGTSPSGWAEMYDGGSRTSALEALARVDRPAAVAQAWELLSKDLTADRIGAQTLVSDWERVVRLLVDEPPDVAVWSEVAAYVDALVAHADALPDPMLPAWGDPTDADTTAAALVVFVADRLEHPARALAQAAQRFMVDRLLTSDRHAQNCVARSLTDFGRSAESALVVLAAVATVDPERVRFATPELEARADVLHFRERRMIAELLHELGHGEVRTTPSAPARGVLRPLPPVYQLRHPRVLRADDLSAPAPGEALPGALHPAELLRLVDGELRIIAKMADVQPEALFSDVVTRAGGISPALDDEAPVRNQLKHYELRISYRRPRGRRIFRAALAAVADLMDHGRLDASQIEALEILFRNTDPALLALRPSPRPDLVAPISERTAPTGDAPSYVRDDWPDHATTQASAVGRVDAQGRVVIAEETWLRWLDWKMPTETRVGVRWLSDVTPKPPALDSDEDQYRAARALASRCVTWSHAQMADYLTTDSDDPMLIVRQDAFRYDTPAPHWLAFNPALARALGWQPCAGGLFRWLNEHGVMMVESVWWEDGFVEHKPPVSEDEVGAGWLVVATTDAWRQISDIIGRTVDWIRVERSMDNDSRVRVDDRTNFSDGASTSAHSP